MKGPGRFLHQCVEGTSRFDDFPRHDFCVPTRAALVKNAMYQRSDVGAKSLLGPGLHSQTEIRGVFFRLSTGYGPENRHVQAFFVSEVIIDSG